MADRRRILATNGDLVFHAQRMYTIIMEQGKESKPKAVCLLAMIR
jgi:hypothetical protein